MIFSEISLKLFYLTKETIHVHFALYVGQLMLVPGHIGLRAMFAQKPCIAGKLELACTGACTVHIPVGRALR